MIIGAAQFEPAQMLKVSQHVQQRRREGRVEQSEIVVDEPGRHHGRSAKDATMILNFFHESIEKQYVIRIDLKQHL